MKKIIRRITTLLLSVFLILGAVPYGGLANSIMLFASARNYMHIKYGNYPQSEVKDSATVDALNQLAGDTDGWKSYGYYSGNGSIDDGRMCVGDYMKYKDVVYGDVKYRGVYFESYRPYYTGYTASATSTFQDDNGYNTNTVCWFKFEPLSWRVLNCSDGLVLCDNIIDSQAYNSFVLCCDGEYYGNASESYFANSYFYSSIRNWLNEDFYNTAFNENQKNNIKPSLLNNDCITKDTQYNSPECTDKVFLLSLDEALNYSYGFSYSKTNYDTARRAEGTDYAKAQGLYTFTGSEYKNNSWWWLRSPYDYSSAACGVHISGHMDSCYNVCITDGGVRPALRLLSIEDDTAQTGVSSKNSFFSVSSSSDSVRILPREANPSSLFDEKDISISDFVLDNVTAVVGEKTYAQDSEKIITIPSADVTGDIILKKQGYRDYIIPKDATVPFTFAYLTELNESDIYISSVFGRVSGSNEKFADLTKHSMTVQDDTNYDFYITTAGTESATVYNIIQDSNHIITSSGSGKFSDIVAGSQLVNGEKVYAYVISESGSSDIVPINLYVEDSSVESGKVQGPDICIETLPLTCFDDGCVVSAEIKNLTNKDIKNIQVNITFNGNDRIISESHIETIDSKSNVIVEFAYSYNEMTFDENGTAKIFFTFFADNTEKLTVPFIVEVHDECFCAHPVSEEIGGYEPTCTEEGVSPLLICRGCGEIVFEEEVIPPTGHTEEIIPAVVPTCTQDGLSEGIYCSICGEILVEQETVPKIGHDFSDGVCTRCGAKEIANEIFLNEAKIAVVDGTDNNIFKFSPSESKTYYFFSDTIEDTYGHLYNADMEEISCDDDSGGSGNFLIEYDLTAGEIYYIEGRFYSSEEIGEFYVSVTDTFTSCHDYCIDSVCEATCISDGGTKRICSRCNDVIDNITQEAYGHSFVNGVCEHCGWIEGLDYEINDGTVLITGYSGNADTIDISSELCSLPVTGINSFAFDGCNSLTEVTIPDSVEIIESYAFYQCINLTSITLPNSITYISDNIFDECSNLQNIIIPESVLKIGCYSFANCCSLKKIVIPNSVTEIGDWAFVNCSDITIVVVGNGIESIGEISFGGCYNLQDIYYCGTEEDWNEIEIAADNSELLNCYVHYISSPDEIESHFHTEVIEEPACECCGTERVTCDCGYEYDRYIPSLEHQMDSVVKTVTPTCTDNGYTIYHCNRCGEDYLDDYIDATGHSFANGVCENCGATVSVILAEDFIHINLDAYSKMYYKFIPEESGVYNFYNHQTKRAYVFSGKIFNSDMERLISCYDEGDYWNNISWNFEAGECYYLEISNTDCETESCYFGISQSTDKVNHQKTLIETVSSTCIDDGYSIYHCDICGQDYYDDYVEACHCKDELIETVEPTCNKKGYSVYHCNRCDSDFTDDYINKKEHCFIDDICIYCNRNYFDCIETDHPYEDGMDKTWIISKPNAIRISITFSEETSLEWDYDYIYIYDKDDILQGTYTGDSLAGETIEIESDVVKIRFVSDGSCNDFGFSLQEVNAFYSDTLELFNDSVIIDEGKICSLSAGITQNAFETYNVNMCDGRTVEYSTETIGTGTSVVFRDLETGEIIDSFEIVIFGDVNGDGWYDGMDSMLVNCIANGMLTREQVGEAVWAAADCNHDGEINQADVDLLNEAGLLLSQVDQTKSKEELKSNSVYQEYLSLIDQSPTEKEAEKPTTQPEKPATEKKTFADLFKTIFDVFIYYFKSLFKITR